MISRNVGRAPAHSSLSTALVTSFSLPIIILLLRNAHIAAAAADFT